MNNRLISPIFALKFVGLVGGGLSAALLTSDISTSRRSPLDASASALQASGLRDTASSLAIATDIRTFGLTLEPQPLIPETLRISRNPADESRGIIGADDRISVTSDAFPWSAIGRLEGVRSDGVRLSRCTGTLIATDVVLTNAHCVLDEYSYTVNLEMRFQPNLVDGRLQNAEDEAEVIEVLYGTDFRDDETANRQDWALLKLDRPLGEIYGVLGWRSPGIDFFQAQEAALTMVGYSGDFPTDNPGATASAHVGCSVLNAIPDGVTHDCDSTSGASGAPIISWIDGLPYVVALHAAMRQNPYTGAEINYAVTLEPIKQQLSQTARE